MEDLLQIESNELLEELESKIQEKKELEKKLQKETQDEFLDDDEENAETVDLKIGIQELNSEIEEIIKELHNRDELPYKYNEWLIEETKQDNHPIHIIDRKINKLNILEKQKPKSEMDKEAILYDKTHLKRELIELLKTNKDNLPDRLEYLLDEYNINKKDIEEEKKEIAHKIAKKEKICVEINEKMKEDLEIVMFYFYRDTSKKMTKKVFEEFCREKIDELKEKMIEDIQKK